NIGEIHVYDKSVGDNVGYIGVVENNVGKMLEDYIISQRKKMGVARDNGINIQENENPSMVVETDSEIDGDNTYVKCDGVTS
ncbi:hypothetical protein Tco_0358024, partial [Tanacetum coccineum]